MSVGAHERGPGHAPAGGLSRPRFTARGSSRNWRCEAAILGRSLPPGDLRLRPHFEWASAHFFCDMTRTKRPHDQSPNDTRAHRSGRCGPPGPRSRSAWRPSSPTSRCWPWSWRAPGARRSCASSWTGPEGVDLALCARVTHHLRDLLADYTVEVSSPGPGAAADQARALPALSRAPGPRAHRRGDRGAQATSRASSWAPTTDGVSLAGGLGNGPHPARAHPALEPDFAAIARRDSRRTKLSKEIVEAVQTLEKEKGISSEKLMLALEDALLSAYKKTPGAAKYARVDMDREHRGLPRVRADPAAGARGEAGRRGDRGGAHDRPGDGRDARARGARDRPGEAGRVRGPDLAAATSRRPTSGGSPPRPPSR